MRLEEKFGRANKQESQTMQQWITYVKMLGSQLRDAEVEIPAVRIDHRILSGLSKEYDSLRYSLKTRPGVLTAEVVTEHLLEVEQDIVTAPVRRPSWYSQEPQYQLNSLTRRPDQPLGRRQLVRRCSMTLRIGQEEVCDLR